MKAIFSREAKKFFDFARWVVYSLAWPPRKSSSVFPRVLGTKPQLFHMVNPLRLILAPWLLPLLQLKNVSGVHCGKFYPNLYRLGCTVLKVFQPWAVASSFLRSSQFSECQPLNQLILEGRFSPHPHRDTWHPTPHDISNPQKEQKRLQGWPNTSVVKQDHLHS